MFKLLVLVLLGYIAWRLFRMNRPHLPPRDSGRDPHRIRKEYTDYEEVDR